MVALAAETDPRGWHTGTTAANTARVLAGLEEPPEIDLPGALALEGLTLLVYFSPTCPHCQDAQPELNALAVRLRGKLTVLGVASGSATAAQLAAYREAYDVPYRLFHDAEREVAAAMGVRSTPSALLVKDGRILDGWYPWHNGFDTLVEMRVLPEPWAAFRPGEFLGNAACAACHTEETEGWYLTHHSVAWRTLVKDGHHTDAACTGCHVTGAGEPTGWTAGTPHLADVGCEACHGPGGPHDGTRTDAASTCTACHDPEHSIAFSYDKGLPHLDHFAATGLSETAFRDRRRALLEGELERPLLAFPEGAHLGAEACRECHAAEHAHWAKTPHATAMATLRTEAAKEHVAHPPEDVACVRCHATAASSGPPPAELEGYRVAESVGCESCHGPGEAHVAAGGGTDNIEGLGEDCPVCVIEAVCTRCHTREWDPDWHLARDLPRVKHQTTD